MQRPGNTPPLISASQIPARINFSPKNVPVPLYAIDMQNTHKRDDAIGWQDTGDGYNVYIAISAAGLNAKIQEKNQRLNIRLNKFYRKKNSFGNGEYPAIWLQYWTNGKQIHQPELSIGLARTTIRYHEQPSNYFRQIKLPDKLKQELFRITNTTSSQKGIEALMKSYNTILAHTAAKQGIAIPYYKHAHKQSAYHAEPTINTKLHSYYTHATRPLYREIDITTNHQLTQLLKEKKPLDYKTMSKFCTHYNKKTSTHQQHNQQAA